MNEIRFRYDSNRLKDDYFQENLWYVNCHWINKKNADLTDNTWLSLKIFS